MRTRPGCSGSLPATGWSSSSPKRRAKATWAARLRSLSRRNRTLCWSGCCLIGADRPSARTASPRFTPLISAPMAQVSCSTRMIDTSSEHEDRRPGGLAGFQVAMGLHCVFQRVVLVDLDADAAVADVVEQLADQLCLFRRI